MSRILGVSFAGEQASGFVGTIRISIDKEEVADPCFGVTVVVGVPKELEWAFDIREGKRVSS